MEIDLVQFLFLLATFLGAVGILIIVYSRSVVLIANKLFILILILILAYLVSHGVHFLFMYHKDVTILDVSCHSFLLLIIVTLTFFTWNFPFRNKMSVAVTIFILAPTLLLLIMLWNGILITESHSHLGRFEAHFNSAYPIYLFWYLFLIGLNIFHILQKRRSETNPQIKSQLLLFLLGLIITNLTSFTFGLFLPWVLGFYVLVEMSPLAFLTGVILFTAVAIGKYNMFPAALDRVNQFSINRKMFLSALILVPIIILIIQIPLGRLIFNIETNLELTRFFLISLFVGIIVSLSITFIIVQVISNPLNKLKAKVIDIEKGNYGTQINYSSNDEIGALSAAFNKMSKTLKKNAVELQGKENRISLLLNAFEKAVAAIAIVDKEFTVIESNKRFCEFVLRERGEVSGKSIRELQFSNDEKFFVNVVSTLNSGENFSGEYEHKISSDGKKYLLISATPVSLPNKEFSGYLFVELDITHRKYLEQQLAHSEKLAALGKMSAVLAHEIKTPLTSIKLNTDMLSESLKLNEEDKLAFNIISKEIIRMNNLVKEVLQFSRQIELNYSLVDIKELVESIFLGCKNKLDKKGITFKNAVAQEQVEIDAEKIKQVLLNLIDNSIESIDSAGTIEIYSKPKRENNTLSIFVRDTGSGIPEGQKIFEPFYTTKASGTGLGLSISQKIIEQHKGDLTLVSSKRGETIFEIVLPV